MSDLRLVYLSLHDTSLRFGLRLGTPHGPVGLKRLGGRLVLRRRGNRAWFGRSFGQSFGDARNARSRCSHRELRHHRVCRLLRKVGVPKFDGPLSDTMSATSILPSFQQSPQECGPGRIRTIHCASSRRQEHASRGVGSTPANGSRSWVFLRCDTREDVRLARRLQVEALVPQRNNSASAASGR